MPSHLSTLQHIGELILCCDGSCDYNRLTSRVTAQRLLATNGANSGFRVGNFEYVHLSVMLGLSCSS